MLPVHGNDLGSAGDEGLYSVGVVRPGRSVQRCPPILSTQIRVGPGSKQGTNDLGVSSASSIDQRGSALIVLQVGSRPVSEEQLDE